MGRTVVAPITVETQCQTARDHGGTPVMGGRTRRAIRAISGADAGTPTEEGGKEAAGGVEHSIVVHSCS